MLAFARNLIAVVACLAIFASGESGLQLVQAAVEVTTSTMTRTAANGTVITFTQVQTVHHTHAATTTTSTRTFTTTAGSTITATVTTTQNRPSHRARQLHTRLRHMQNHLDKLLRKQKITEAQHAKLSQSLAAIAKMVDEADSDGRIAADELRAIHKAIKAHNMDVAEAVHADRNQAEDGNGDEQAAGNANRGGVPKNDNKKQHTHDGRSAQ